MLISLYIVIQTIKDEGLCRDNIVSDMQDCAASNYVACR